MFGKNTHNKKSIIFRSTIPSLIIVIFTIFILQQFETNQHNKSQESIDDFKQVIDNLLERRIGNIQTIANSVLGFYLGSENVETHEFNAFSEKILESNPDVINLFVINNDKIIESYPHSKFQGHEMESILPDYPVIINEQKTMLIEFPIKNNMELVIGIPFDYFISAKFLVHDPIKIKLFDSTSSRVLYRYDSTNPNSDEEIIFSSLELEEAISINKQTSIIGHKIGEAYTLEYLIWTDDFNPKIETIEVGLIVFGISFAVILFILLYRSFVIQQKLQVKTKEVEQANIDLKEAIRMRNEFSTMINHELKTPLTPIKGFCHILLKQKIGTLNEKQLDYVNEISMNAEQLEELIENLLIVRKLDMDKLTFQITNIDTGSFLHSIYENWKILTDKHNLKLIVNEKDNMCIKADEKKLRQVFSNLIKNAVDFVPENTGEINIDVVDNGKFVIFGVKDNGIGISKENQERLFQKFYQVDISVTRNHGGTGLGLSICKGLIEGMGGKLWVESDLGKGTTFYFKLPSCNSA